MATAWQSPSAGERHFLCHSLMIGADAIDGLMNHDAVKSDIDSTETHGCTEAVLPLGVAHQGHRQAGPLHPHVRDALVRSASPPPSGLRKTAPPISSGDLVPIPARPCLSCDRRPSKVGPTNRFTLAVQAEKERRETAEACNRPIRNGIGR